MTQFVVRRIKRTVLPVKVISFKTPPLRPTIEELPPRVELRDTLFIFRVLSQ